jgi:DNA topoisomerase II
MTKDNAKLAKQYQSMTALEHISKKPDTYIGAVEKDTTTTWTYDNNENKIVYKSFNWVPGFYKCFDEALVNARDHQVRMSLSKEKNKNLVKNIEVSCIDGALSVLNDGNGIDIEIHPKDKKWIPEMVFMHLRTSTNYDDEEKKLVGGKNGFGIKLVFIFAKWGIVETVDHVRKLKYTQRVENNLSLIHKPQIEKYTGKPYTKVTWFPDYKRFGLDGMTDDIWNHLQKRAYDIAGVTNKSMKVKLQDEIIPIKSFEQYVDMYIGEKEEVKRLYQNNERWECVIALSPLDEFAQVSFVNGINTGKGGKHVDYIVNQICKKMIEYIKKKKKVSVKPITIKEQLIVFVNCMIENPAFDSQTKDYMNTPVSKFGSKFEITDKTIDKLAKMGVMDAAISLNEVKENKAARKTDGRKSRVIKGIPKLIDANKAGGPDSYKCSLILCEGDSAKSGVMSGLSKKDRDWYGIFPLKGKLLNTLDANQTKINNNAEIANIKKIMGLVTGKIYKNKKDMESSLRYGKILIMTDQDLDGSHIKALCLNFFNSQWRDLFETEGFIGYMNTPIIKATKGKNVKQFYNENAYHKWKKAHNNAKGWKIKYYKGLGTSTANEFKEYMANKKVISFNCEGQEDLDSIDKVFNKTRADDRKEWLGKYDKDKRLDTTKDSVSIREFIDGEMIHFSKYDCERSIANLIDGFKTSQRKIIYTCFKRKLTKEVKVAQLSGSVSEISEYHHGEMSLVGAIIKLAQEYPGSNNLNPLYPGGQFGTRLEGGSDAASPRYIRTMLNKITRCIFREEDDKILNYLDEDGILVEPDYYMPTIPMILVNGGKGIGTGFSYEVLQYNVLTICKYLKNRLNGVKKEVDWTPYYENFKGSIEEMDNGKFMIKGKYKTISHDTVKITELPIGLWTTNFKEHLEYLMDEKTPNGKKKKPLIKSFKDDCTDSTIDFTIRFQPGQLSNLATKKVDKYQNMLEKTLKLTTTKGTTNMYLFDEKQQLKKYSTVEAIIDRYYPVRFEGYENRKKYQLKILERKMNVLNMKARFIKEVMDGTIVLVKKKKKEVIEILKNKNYKTIDGDDDYGYLRGLPVDSMEEENWKKLLKDLKDCEAQYIKLKKKSIQQMWSEELEELESEFKKYQKEREKRVYGVENKKSKIKKTKKKPVK